MQQFDLANKEKFKKWLYFSSIHDSEIENVQYDSCKSTLVLKISNAIDKVHFQMTFVGVKKLLFINEDRWGDDQSVSSLTVEDDYTPISALNGPSPVSDEKNLYLVFQMFSGNELHILVEKLLIE